MPENLFISYARTDGEAHARKLTTDLQALGHEVWFDKDRDDGIKAGRAWQSEIEAGIDNCTVFLMLITPQSVISVTCNAEQTRALNKNKPIIPLIMNPTDNAPAVDFKDLPLYIAPLQYIDCVADFDAGWDILTYRLTQLNDEKFRAEQTTAQQTHRMIPAAATGYLLTDPDDVPRLPDTLIGRDDLKITVESYLVKSKIVTLHGIGGIGKSSLIAWVIAHQLATDPTPVLWLEVGNASSDNAFTQIGQVFGVQKEMLAATDDKDKQKLTRDLLRAHNIKTVVIDDAWNPATLASLMGALPRFNPLPTIVTSRQIRRHITGGEMLSVEALAPQDARTLLTHHMGNGDTDGADDLCAAVYYHPFLLEVAGKLLAQRDIPPRRLLDEMDDVVALAMPEGASEAGRENMAKLLQQSLDALPDDLTRKVFMAFGHLPTTITTPELLALLLRDDLDDMNEESYNEYMWERPIPIHDLPDLPAIQKALETLFTHGLVKRLPAEIRGGYPYTVERFRLHDLAHSYATARTNDPERMVTACLVLTWRHNQPTYDNFAALRSDLDNLMGASATAMTLKRWRDAEQFSWNVNSPDGSNFFFYQGYYSDTVTLLTQAADAANQRGDKQAQGAHLGNLGIAYASLGQYDTAIDYYQQRIVIADEIDDKEGKGNALGNLGNAYNSLGQYDTAIDYHKQDLAISREIGNKLGEGQALGNLGNAYYSLGQYDTAIDHHKQDLAISRELGNKLGEGQALGNLGVVYKNLGQHEEAITYYEQALAVSREIGDRNNVAIFTYNLGILYNDTGRYADAIPLLEESLALYTDMGLHHEIPDVESALARARRGDAES